MTPNPEAGRRIPRARLVAPILFSLLLAACVSDESAPELAVVDRQPTRATYDCGEDGRISLENMRTSVRLVEGDGDSYDLPASPPTQTSRYGEGGYALVLDGREALWMKARHEPVTCRR